MSAMTLAGSGGAGAHKATKWVKWGLGLFALVVLWATSVTWGLFLATAIGAVLVVIDCAKHPSNILRAIGYLIFGVALSLNVLLGAWQQAIGQAVISGGDRTIPIFQSQGGLLNGGKAPLLNAPQAAPGASINYTPVPPSIPGATTPPTTAVAAPVPAAAPIPGGAR